MKEALKKDPITALQGLFSGSIDKQFDGILKKAIDSVLPDILKEVVGGILHNKAVLDYVSGQVFASIRQPEDGYTPQKGIDYNDGLPGEPGYTPQKGKDYFTQTEIQEIIRMVFAKIEIPEIKDGMTPKKYVDYFTPEDIKTMVDRVISQVPEQKTPAQIVAGINELPVTPDKQIDAKHIKNLPKNKSVETAGTIHRGGGDIFYIDDISDQTNGITYVFTLTKKPKAITKFILLCSDFPSVLRPTVDFTISGKVLTLNNVQLPEAPTSGSTLIAQYTI